MLDTESIRTSGAVPATLAAQRVDGLAANAGCHLFPVGRYFLHSPGAAEAAARLHAGVDRAQLRATPATQELT